MKKWRPVLAWVYFIGFLVYIYYRWTGLSLQAEEYIRWESLGILALTFFSLLIESQKWRILIWDRISIQSALSQILAGYSTAVFSPGQLGHFLGRKILHRQLGWWKATGATLLGGFWQTLTFIVYGTFSLWWLIIPEGEDGFLKYLEYGSLLLVIIFLVILQLITPIHRWLSTKYWSRTKWIRPVLSILAAMRSRSWTHHAKLLALSLLKAAIIYTQFALLIYIGGGFQIDLQVILIIPIVFLIITLLPLPSMLGLIARGEIVLQLWNLYDLNAEKAYISVYALWVFNIMIPALLGTLLILIHQKKWNL